jgi:hypothetical protein
MSLSIKEFKDMAEKEDVAAFMESQSKGPTALGEKLKEQLGSAVPDEGAEAPAAPEADGTPAEDAAVAPATEPESET